jgi:quinoprotein glucose dehydrogenase
MRFSPVTQITPANVSQLKVAWTYHMKPEAVSTRFASSEVTPLVVNGTMFLATPYNRVVAVDPTTGREIWAFRLPAGNPSTRGVEYWPGDAQTPPQIVFGSSDGKLYSLDAKTGKLNEAFGAGGIVNLDTPEILQGLPGSNGLSSPPIVFKNLVITGGKTQENPPRGPAGDVRAWDMHTGKLVWTFHSVPRAGEKYNDTWAGDSWKNRTGVNVWGFMTVDAQRGIVYMPFGAPSVDQYGGDREGNNLFGTSIVAADANTGKYLWHFQVVHHDIWDGDLAGAPALIDVKRAGAIIPAVAVINKVGLLFLLDRVTGRPIYGVEERAVPQTEVPLERTSKTQPFPLKPAPLSRISISAADIATVTPELEAACKKLIAGVQLGGPYLPVSYNRLRVQFPGNHGGVNWGGTSFNPQLGYLFVSTSELGQMSGLRDRDPMASGPARAEGLGNRVDPDGPYQGVPGGGRFKDTASNMMCQQPPWGQLTAVNVNTGELAWRVPLGITESLPPEKQKTGRPGNGGTIATAAGLIFVGATDDSRFRAFDAKTGKELWTFTLPGAAEATPMTYEGRDGQQYVVTVATGGAFGTPVTADSIIAFALGGALRPGSGQTQYSAITTGDVVELRDSRADITVPVVTTLGNAYQMVVKSQKVIRETFSDLAQFRTRPGLNGVPLLAPFANRLDEQAFYANGKKYSFDMGLGNVRGTIPIHGFLTGAKDWRLVEAKADAQAAWVTTTLDFYRNPQWMKQFPFAHTITMTYRLQDGALEVRTRIDNLSNDPMPVAIGFHPYFQLTDSPRDEWTVSLDAKTHWLLAPNFIPTGETESIERVSADPHAIVLKDRSLDDVFGDLTRDKDGRAVMSIRGKAQQLDVALGPNYRAMVVYSPKASAFVALEPMVGITDSMNLAQKGLYKELQSIPPGGFWQESFWIRPRGF